VVDGGQRVVVIPANQIVMQGAFRRQILRDIAPLTSRAEHIHDPVDDLANVDLAVSPAVLGWRDERLDKRPFRVGQVARVAQLVAVVFGTVIAGPHRVARPFVGL